MGHSYSTYDRLLYNNLRASEIPELEPDFEHGICHDIHYLHLKTNSSTVIMISHANHLNIFHKTAMMKYISSNFNCDVLAYDYYGFGMTPGNPSSKNCMLSAKKIYHFLSESYIHIILWGESIGGGVNSELFKYLFEEKYPLPSAIVHHHSFDEMKGVVHNLFFKYIPEKFFMKMPIDHYPVYKIYQELLPDNLPLIIIYSPDDDYIDRKHSLKLYDYLKETKKVSLIQNYGIHCSHELYTSDVFLIRGILSLCTDQKFMGPEDSSEIKNI